MAIPADPVAAVEAQIWALLLASQDFKDRVRVANRLKSNDAAKQRNIDPRTARQPADLPAVEITQGNYRATPYRPTVTFGTFDPDAATPRIIDRSQEFIVKITTDDEGTTKARELAWLIEGLLIDTPQLGLPAIVRLVEDFAATTQLTNQGKAAGVMRRQITATLRVLMRQNVPAA